MSRSLTEIELRSIVPSVRSLRRSLRIGWAVARWVFRGCLLLCLGLGVFKFLDDGSWGALLGLGALGGFMGLLSLALPSGNDGRRDPQEGDTLEAHWIRGTHELVHVGSGKTSRWIHVIGGSQIIAPPGWLDDLPVGEEAVVEVVAASTPSVSSQIDSSLWIVAIRGKRSLRAELEAGCTDDPALAASLWWWCGGMLLGACLIALLLTDGFPPQGLRELPAAWSPRARIPATEGWVAPAADPRPGDGFELGAYFVHDKKFDPEEGMALAPWTPSERDSFLQAVQGIRERMARASRAADSARSVLWAFRPAFHNTDMEGVSDLYRNWSARAFRREWPTRATERKRWLARMDTLLPGDSAWSSFLREVSRWFASVDSSSGDTARGHAASEAIHREVLRLLHPDSSRPLLYTENAILRDAWTRSSTWIRDASLAPGVLLVTDSATQRPIPERFDPGEQWLRRPESFDGSMLDSLPSAFRPAGAHAVWSHVDGRWAVVRLGEPTPLRDLLLSLRFWLAFFAASGVWLIVGTWKIFAWRRASAIAKAASAEWWTRTPEG